VRYRCPRDRILQREVRLADGAREPAASGGRTIKLAVVILAATGTNPEPDPLVILSGGPAVGHRERVATVQRGLRRPDSVEARHRYF